jgi:chromosome segregation protein
VRSELARADKQHRQLESRLARTRERIAVLSELEQRLEGLDGGVKEVLRLAREEPEGPFGDVCGVVADLFHVDVDSAHLIEVALGERAQFVVVASGARLLEYAQREPLAIGGKAGFLRLDSRAMPNALDHVDLSAEAGVMGRADQFVETASEFGPLVKRLLGRTWLVDRLATALRLAQAAGRGFDFVTSDSELLTADGTLLVGPRSVAAGIMSRRSELRSCQEQISDLEKQVSQYSTILSRLDQQRSQQESLVASTVASYSELTTKLADCRQHTAAARAELERVTRDVGRLEGELKLAEERIVAIALQVEHAAGQRSTAETTAIELRKQMVACQGILADCERRRDELQAALVERQVLEAKSEQRVEMLRQQHEISRRNRRERASALDEMRARLADLRVQAVNLEERMLIGRQELAALFLRKEWQAHERAAQSAAHEVVRRDRVNWNDQVRELRQLLASVQAQQHKLDVATSRLQHDRQTLCERMHDDYGIDLAEEAGSREQGARSGEQGAGSDAQKVRVTSGLPAGYPLGGSQLPASFDRAAAEREIADLRDQINGIGAVNLEALDELEQLETRFATLSGQYRDLVDAKASLERIVQRINVDSRQLFLATLELVRGHFQELFRRMFGGGEADIVVDEAEDVLESGIEIVARPPGKEACSISLLSGGEKTLTCVALLLAVFRSKPSPFCILDEVDAALDEANIGRFSGVLREFLSFTQFVVVTHSKKTMSGADTLYGVTMEEAGVSKRVSVRFEDVSEDGQIRPSALRSAHAIETGEPQRRAA